MAIIIIIGRALLCRRGEMNSRIARIAMFASLSLSLFVSSRVLYYYSVGCDLLPAAISAKLLAFKTVLPWTIGVELRYKKKKKKK